VISVLLPYRDAVTTLDVALRSVLDDLGENDEVVAVDDGSTDAGPAIVRALAERDRRVVGVDARAHGAHGAGVGVARALAVGLDACHRDAEWIARMDADDVSLPGRFAAQRALLHADSSLGAVATRIELFGAPGPGIQRYADWQNGLLTAADHAREIFIEAPVCHPSTMIRRAALHAMGGFRDGPFAEDYDLWLRLVAAGWGIAKVPEILFRWRIQSTSVTFRDPRLSDDALRRLRAEHLARRIDRPFGMWGAGPAGRRLARELERRLVRTTFFIDIDPRKIGRTARSVPILDVERGVARAKSTGELIVVAVAAYGARELVREHLCAAGMVEPRDFVCAV
jgi:glycosyltransferase involved in cell wall biosynthesis